MQQIRATLHRVAGLYENLVDDAVGRGGNLVLHLHRFEDEQAGAAADLIPLFDEHPRDPAGHEGLDDAAVAEVVIAALPATRDRIDDVDVPPSSADRDLMR